MVLSAVTGGAASPLMAVCCRSVPMTATLRAADAGPARPYLVSHGTVLSTKWLRRRERDVGISGREAGRACSAQPGAGAARRRRGRGCLGYRGADDALAGQRARRQADVPLPLRRRQGRDPRRHRRSRLQRDRAAGVRRRLAVADAPAGQLGPPRAAAPPLGDRADGVTSQSRPGDAAPPRRDPRHPARRGLLGGHDRPRLRPAGQLHLRIRAPGGRSALQRGDRHRVHRGDDAAIRRRVPLPDRDRDRAHPPARLRLRRRVRSRAHRHPRRPQQVHPRPTAASPAWPSARGAGPGTPAT